MDQRCHLVFRVVFQTIGASRRSIFVVRFCSLRHGLTQQRFDWFCVAWVGDFLLADLDWTIVSLKTNALALGVVLVCCDQFALVYFGAVEIFGFVQLLDHWTAFLKVCRKRF